MCRLLATFVGVAFNVAIGVWALGFPGEWKAWAALFFVPAASSLALLCARRGSCVARAAGSGMVVVGLVKLCCAVLLGALAAAAGQSSNMLGGLGVLVYALFAVVVGASGAWDVCVGAQSACAARGTEFKEIE